MRIDNFRLSRTISPLPQLQPVSRDALTIVGYFFISLTNVSESIAYHSFSSIFFCLFILDVFCVRLPGRENNRFYESKLLTQQLSTILAGLSVSRVLAGLPYVCVCDRCLRSFRKAHFASGPETIEHGFLSLLLLSVGLRLQERERETPDVPPPASPPPPPPSSASSSSPPPPPPSLSPLSDDSEKCAWLGSRCANRGLMKME